ncbi:peptidoglycan-binding protein [Acuticoccus sp. M5D2P5]|uniref:peptidoglycan-binding domain-containing protein n=1 Tax=Acuticoccus kalidii TaxID=2910977 RepID=UPI001F23E6E7|nr:peptidoglycan-binding domain-containing protein [Acuticoccus kalidii]MCF3935854.1 peptidoglycan-binding protein [Acuticoccus kalidii]
MEPQFQVNRRRDGLQYNPFYLLDADASSTGPELRERLDDAQFEAVHDEAVLADAFSRLSSPRGRVQAELAWPFMLPHAHIMELARHPEDARKRAAVGIALDEASALGLANVLVHAASSGVADGEHIREIDDAWGRVADPQVVSALTALHRRSGSPPPDSGMISPAIEELLRDHVATVHEAMDRAGRAPRWMTDLAERAVENGRCGRFLSRLAERYDAACEADLQMIRGQIHDMVTKVRAVPDRPGEHLAELPRLLAAWDELNQPIQLLEQLRGHEEGRSRALANDLRDLAIWLANEKQLYPPAATITDCLLETFPELDHLTAQLLKDRQALRELTEEQEQYGPLLTLSRLGQAATVDPGPLVADAGRRGFDAANDGTAGEFAQALRAAVAFTAGSQLAEVPWVVALKLLQHLRDDAGAPGAAAMLGDFALGLPKIPSRAVRKALTSERDLARRAARSAGQPTTPPRPAAPPAREPGLPTENAGEAKVGAIRAGRSSTSLGPAVFCLFVILAAFVPLFILGAEDGTGPGAPPPPASTANALRSPEPAGDRTPLPQSRPIAAVARPSAGVTPRRAFVEKPQAGYGRILDVQQIRWCLFEAARLDGARNAADNVTQSQVDAFNARIEDLNARCGNYRYHDADMTEAREDLAAHRSSLGREGAAWIDAIRVPPRPSASRRAGPTEAALTCARIEAIFDALDTLAKPSEKGWARDLRRERLRNCAQGSFAADDMASARSWVAGEIEDSLRAARQLVSGYRASFADALKDRELARRVQRRLKALGYYRSAIDGAFGRGSVAALLAFKRDHPRLPANAVWDPDTSAALLK